GTSIGEEIDRVAAVQKKGGLDPLVASLDKLAIKLKTYKSGVAAKHKPWAEWVGSNIEKWVAGDKQKCLDEIALIDATYEAVGHQMTKAVAKGYLNGAVNIVEHRCLSARGVEEGAYANAPVDAEDVPKILEVFAEILEGLNAIATICNGARGKFA